ncbi:MAG: hypothetical protein K8W52_32330 [Deltaproteobacteria bacterium]|nr:hypothetical protein [Deltaproteobacteria bacterium]
MSFACLAACGGGGDNFPDANNTDANNVDSGVSIDATVSGAVTVTTRSRCCTDAVGTLIAGVPVIAVQPDGTALPTVTTDASGVAALTGVQLGATITAIYDTTEGPDLVTVVGVKPGDHLEFGEKFTPTTTGVEGTMTLTFPDNGAYYFQAFTPCGAPGITGPATQLTLFQYTYCQTPTADILLVAYDTSFNVIASARLHATPYTNDITASVSAWTPGITLTPTLTGLTADTTYVSMVANSIADTVYYNDNVYPDYATGTASAPIQLPAGTDRIALSVSESRTGDVGSHVEGRSLAPAATTAAIASNQLPWLGQTTVSGAGSVAQWIQVGTGAYDGAVAYANWSRFDATADTTVYYSWTLVLPPGISSYSWAGAPAALADYLPGLGDSVNGDVILVDLTDATGYDGLRAAPEWISSCPECAIRQGDLPGADIAYSFSNGGCGGRFAKLAGKASRACLATPTR